MKVENLPKELQEMQEKVEKISKKLGLDTFPTVFQMCDNEAINTLAAREGFPERYPHWRFGMNYNDLKNQSDYGWGKIYELVINTNPCYAYLLNTNSMMDQKLVMAHVMGHNDFFKNNDWYKATDRNMMNTMATHATKIKKYMKKYGRETVEDFMDKVLSLENLISTADMFENSATERARAESKKKLKEEIKKNKVEIHDEVLKKYMNEKPSKTQEKEEDDFSVKTKLKNPQRDVLKFLAENAELKDWQSDIISMIRAEAYYYLPQRMTKIMNEGWASYWHSEIMTKYLLTANEVVDFSDTHASVMYMSPQNINPYKVGIELFRDIKERWDKGQFGIDYMKCDDLYEKENWDTGAMKGLEKIFQVRKVYNDVSFIDEFLTEDFCKRNKMFVYQQDPRTGKMTYDSSNFPKIKEMLLNQLANGGSPVIEVVDNNFQNRMELLLKHSHHGTDLEEKYINAVMKNLCHIWKRPVHLQTIKDERPCLISYKQGDGLTETPL